MREFAWTLTEIFCATSVEQTVSRVLLALVNLLQPNWACLLLRDTELGRYIIGETWLSAGNNGRDASTLRRYILKVAQAAQDQDAAHIPEPGFFYQPLHTAAHHVGAFCAGINHLPATNDGYDWLLKSASHALYTIIRLEQADQGRRQLEAEQARLEQLLLAVEQQQRTIDRLLAAERQLSSSLEAKVEERTAALRTAQTRLIQSEKLAVIGQLASSLAHELNNPLQIVHSGLGLVMNEIERGNSSQVRDDLSTIQQELDRIGTIFHQMLDFYRPVSFEYVPLDLNAICESVGVLMRKCLQEANVVLIMELTESLPLTCGDSNQIKQILINLILNAAEALSPDGGTITLQTAHNGQEAWMSLIDDGPGLAPQHQAHVFEPLFTTKTRGLGLGLAISQEIAQQHGGCITVHSTPGQGATFNVILPVKEQCYDE
jgi:C4-dicarboxylate-specific signal transduction histidine kinase